VTPDLSNSPLHLCGGTGPTRSPLIGHRAPPDSRSPQDRHSRDVWPATSHPVEPGPEADTRGSSAFWRQPHDNGLIPVLQTLTRSAYWSVIEARHHPW